MDVLVIPLLVITLVLGALTVELNDLLHSVICLCGMCVSIGLLFGILNALHVMVFQFLIYGGASIVLFVSIVMLTRRGDD